MKKKYLFIIVLFFSYFYSSGQCPIVDAPDLEICSGGIPSIVFTSASAGTVFNWTVVQTGVSGASNGSGGIGSSIAQALAATGSVAGTATYTIIPSPNPCNSTFTVPITVYPIPMAIATPATQTVCSQTPISTILLSSAVPLTNFDWNRDNTTNVTGIANSGNGDISGTLTNTTTTSQTVTFTISPSADCFGTNITATVIVPPKPIAAATNSAQNICSGSAMAAMALSSTVGSTTFAWTRDKIAEITGIASSGGTTNISGTLTNTTNAPVTITFTIIPTASGCVGAPLYTTVLVNPLPVITTQPVTTGTCGAASTSLTVVATGTTSYQWYRNGVALTANATYSNVTTATLNVTTADAASYTVLVGNAAGCTVLSNAATFTINSPPAISSQPANATVCTSGTATFSVTATGVLGYQWKNGGVNLANGGIYSGVNTPTLTITNPATAGNYAVDLTSTSCPTVSSNTAALTVNASPVITAQPPNTAGVCTGVASTSLSVTATGATTYQWYRGGVILPVNARYTGFATATLNIATPAIGDSGSYTVLIGNGTCTTTSSAEILSISTLPTISAQPVSASVCTNASRTFSVTASGVTTYQWQKGGVNLANGGIYSGVATATLTITNPPLAENGASYTVLLNGASCPLTSNAAVLNVNAPPAITVQPTAPAAVCAGAGNTTLSVTATGGTSYQWKRNGTNVGVNASSYTFATTVANAGSYTVVVSNGGCSVTSTAVTVTITAVPTPAIEILQFTGNTTETINVCGTVTSGGQNDFDIVAGTNPGGGATYLWQYSVDNGVTWFTAPGPTATNTQYVLNPLYTTFESTAGIYKFRLIISKNGCSGTSNTITITVNGTSNLNAGAVAGNQSSCGAGTFNPGAFSETSAPTGGGTGSYTHQWQSSTDNITFTNIGGATAATYDALSISVTTYYRRYVVKGGCSAFGNTITVFVGVPPSVTSAATGTICSGTAQNYVITSSSPSSYTWTRAVVAGIGNVAGSGTISPITEILNNTTNAPVVVRYVITPTIGSCTGTAFNYNVTVNPTPKATIGASQTVCSGGTANFSVALVGTAPWNITYSDGTTSTTVNNVNTNPFVFSVPGIVATKTYTITALSDSKCIAQPADLTGSAVVTVATGTPGLWTGLVSTDWSDCRNWAGPPPSSTINAQIPTGSPFMPVITSSAIAFVQDLIIASGASVTMTANSELRISRDWKNSGTFTPGTGTVTFNGATANEVQTINVGIKTNETFYNLITNTTGGAKGISVVDGFILTVSNNLSLVSGDIRLTGEAQLIQSASTANPTGGTGMLLIDQQGQNNSFNYNYWSSPVSTNNTTYSISAILRDGTDVTTNPFSPGTITFGAGASAADAAATIPKTISTYWLYSYNSPTPDTNTDVQNYFQWNAIGSAGIVKVGEGFTMKGTDGTASLAATQNYVYVGKPNSGDIALNLPFDQTYLVGNPYPSTLDADAFILDNLTGCAGCTGVANVFNGALYFWDHFGLTSNHFLAQYVGGYATYTLTGGVRGISNDPLTANTGSIGTKLPLRYIPVAQGFFVDAALDPTITGTSAIVTGGTLNFKNSQRTFVKESSGNSLFIKTAGTKKASSSDRADTRLKIRLGFDSPTGMHRQLLVGADSNTTNQFDIGYDAPMFDLNDNDVYWEFSNSQFVIQAVPNFNDDQKISLGITVANDGISSIKIDALENIPNTLEIYLYDNVTRIYHDIKNNPFPLSLAIGEYNNRFSLQFANKTFSVEKTNLDEGIIVYFTNNNNVINIKNNFIDAAVNKVYLFDLLGQSITDWKIEDIKQNNIQIPIKNVNSGIYIVKIKTSKGDFSKKIIIK